MASEVTQALLKALEAGNYNAAPSTLVQGSALQVEDLSNVMNVTTWDEKSIKLQKGIKTESCKSTLAQFDRQLSYASSFTGAAQYEGAVGPSEDGQFVRITVPMAYYSHQRKVTMVANMIATVDGVKAEDRSASDGAKFIAGVIEMECFRGKSDFSNAGLFDGNMAAIPALPGMLGLDAQIRMSDSERNAKDLMFSEFGADESVQVVVGGVMTQDAVEDLQVKSAIHNGEADTLFMGIRELSAYNKISFGKERIILAGSAQDSTGSTLKKQHTSGGDISLESSRFLQGKTGPAAPRENGPVSPTFTTAFAVGTTSSTAGVYTYFVTNCNEIGESPVSPAVTATTTAAGDYVTLTITPVSAVAKYFNVYRTNVGAPASTAKFVGRVANSGAATTVFTDLFNMKPGATTAFLVDKSSYGMKELAPFSSVKLAVTDLSIPAAHLRFCALAVVAPRKNSIGHSVTGSF